MEYFHTLFLYDSVADWVLLLYLTAGTTYHIARGEVNLIIPWITCHLTIRESGVLGYGMA